LGAYEGRHRASPFLEIRVIDSATQTA